MNIHDLEKCFFIKQDDVDKLEKLGLLEEVNIINGQRDFKDDDVGQMMDMIHLIKLGFNEENLVNYYTNKELQLQILKKTRLSILEKLHIYQKKLDEIDYIIYQKSKNV